MGKKTFLDYKKGEMSNQNTSYYTVYKYNYQYNIAMLLFCCKYVSEKNNINVIIKSL